ncbi:MAG: MBL fold metallo-hydrolase [Spirochaetaceae bacterium]|nr:MAG: MBL fold metallo-hydrolase [Spirochaetaceae bacterium]
MTCVAPRRTSRMFLRQIYDDALAQAAYLIGCQQTGEALVIDPERDIDRYYRLAADNGLTITAVAETHIHADFVSGAQEFAADPAVTLYLSSLGGDDWSYTWPGPDTRVHYLKDKESFFIGKIEIQAIHSPGHTPEHLSYAIIDHGGGADEPVAVVTGDFVFVGDVGRPDLLESAAGVAGAMEPSARTLRASLAQRLVPLPDFVQVLPGHGAGSACGKALGAIPSSTIGYERRFNGVLKLAETDAEGFVREILSGQPEPPLYFKRMKHVNRDGIRVTGGVPSCSHLSPRQFADLAGHAGVQVVDTRADRSAFETAHVSGSLCAPLSGSSLVNSAGSFLTENDSLLLVVDDQSVLDQVTRQLYRIGFDDFAGWATFSELEQAGLAISQLQSTDFDRFSPAEHSAGARLLDVRNRSEYDEGHITGAVNVSYTRLRERIDELPSDARYYVYCASGRRAALASSFLRARGYDVVLVNGSAEAYFQTDVA